MVNLKAFRFHLKARTCLDPFLRFYLSVSVQVGTQVTMPANAAAEIVTQQREDKYVHRMNLPFRAGVGRTIVIVEAALIANTDTIQVVSFGVRTYPFNLPRRLGAIVLTDVEIIPHTVETTAAVAHLQIFFREIPVLRG